MNARRAAAEAALMQSLRASTRSIGGDAAYFILRTRDGDMGIHHLLLACDARWGVEYAAHACTLNDPWFRYATGNSAPVLAADVFCDSRQERGVVDLQRSMASAMRRCSLRPPLKADRRSACWSSARTAPACGTVFNQPVIALQEETSP